MRMAVTTPNAYGFTPVALAIFGRHGAAARVIYPWVGQTAEARLDAGLAANVRGAAARHYDTHVRDMREAKKSSEFDPIKFASDVSQRSTALLAKRAAAARAALKRTPES